MNVLQASKIWLDYHRAHSKENMSTNRMAPSCAKPKSSQSLTNNFRGIPVQISAKFIHLNQYINILSHLLFKLSIGSRIDGCFKDKCSHRADIGTGPAGTAARPGGLWLAGKRKARFKPPSDKRYQGMSPG
jgi:hypothetical protein